MGKLNSGDLDQRVTITTPGASEPDGRGGWLPAGDGTDVTVWAAVRELSGKEVQQYGQTLNNRGIAVTLRKDCAPAYSASQRVAWAGETFNVHRVENDTRNEFITLTCFTSGR